MQYAYRVFRRLLRGIATRLGEMDNADTMEHTARQEGWMTPTKAALNGSSSEPIRWTIARTKRLSEIKASDVPRGLSAEDIAIDYRAPSSSG
jgi:hypothetical protein